jgi:hypothetical protein
MRLYCFGDKRFHFFFANSITPVTKQFVLPQFFEKRCFVKKQLANSNKQKTLVKPIFQGIFAFSGTTI